MAAATALAPVLDLTSQSTFPIRLGASILKPAESKKYTSVRYNHKAEPDVVKGVKATIRRQERDGLELEWKDGSKEYEYRGKNIDGKKHDRYVLVPRGSGRDREMVLERLTACTEFNLEILPDGSFAEYPPLPEDDASEDGQGLEDSPPDNKNPFDYRHYLEKAVSRPKASSAKAPATLTTTSRPPAASQNTASPSQPAKRTNGPLASQQKKRKAPEAPTKPNPKRVKAGTDPAPAPPPSKTTTAPPRQKNVPDIPRVRIDRKASVRVPAPALEEDSGELVLEDETPVQEKPPSSMSLALSGHFGGPISLHSAASTPASKVASPAPKRPRHFEDEDGEFEIGGSSPEAPPPHGVGLEESAGEEEEDEDADADVEDFELPSPAQLPRPAIQETALEADDDDDDDDDDLDEQLARAMAEGDDDDDDVPAVVLQPGPESDEESEEE